jgi:E3 ubiquitin-protein ligase ZNF598
VKPQVSGNVSLKNILGSTTGPVVSAWQPKSGDGNGLANTAVVEEQGEASEGHVSGDATATAKTKGKKGKAKQKQTLFTMGSFPT